MRRLLIIGLLLLAACGNPATKEEMAAFREACHEQGGHVLRVHDFDIWTDNYECFDARLIEINEAEWKIP